MAKDILRKTKTLISEITDDVKAEEAKKKREIPPTVELKKVEGGYIAVKRGGKINEDDDYHFNPGKEVVFKTYDEATEGCKEHMKG